MKIFVSGGNGFLGQHVMKVLKQNPKNQVNTVSSKECDLRLRKNCEKSIKDKDIVISLAGNVGGIGYNDKFPYTLFYDNAILGIELMEAARKAGVKKYVQIGTICSYPKNTPTPFKEEDLYKGQLEFTNLPYGEAKKVLLVQAQAARRQFGFNVIYLLPVNLYGPGDNFDQESSHVIPAMIRKFSEGVKLKLDKVILWGTGTPTREFLYVEDAARGIVDAMEKYDNPKPVNLGSGMEISIKDLALKISDLIGYKGAIVFDESKPDGQPRRLLDVTRAEKEFGFKATTDFDKGLKKTIEWYKHQL